MAHLSQADHPLLAIIEGQGEVNVGAVRDKVLSLDVLGQYPTSVAGSERLGLSRDLRQVEQREDPLKLVVVVSNVLSPSRRSQPTILSFSSCQSAS